jgi:hypothetical protein
MKNIKDYKIQMNHEKFIEILKLLRHWSCLVYEASQIRFWSDSCILYINILKVVPINLINCLIPNPLWLRF